MNKTVFALTMLASGVANAGNIALPAPETTGGKPLMQALTERKTVREFADKPVSAKAKDIVLEQVGKQDLREFLGPQDFARQAPLTLLFVEKPNKYAGMHAGSAYQNVGLYCASAGLNNVVRGMYDAESLAKALNLGDKEVIVTQTVGYPV